MKPKIPFKDLIRLNWLMAMVVSGFIALFLFTYLGFTRLTVFSVIRSGVDLFIVGLFHIFVLHQLQRHDKQFWSWKSRTFRFILTFIASIIFLFLSSKLYTHFHLGEPNKHEDWQTVVSLFSGSLLATLVIIIMHNLVIVYQAHNDAALENAQLKAANAEATNQLLRQQIHPHFLFNALTTLKSLYKKDAGAGDTYIVHLANFLRAAISNTTARLVTLEEEIRICNDYIAMQKIRFGEALQCRMDVSGIDTRKAFLPSFSLQPLIENAIKHNEVTEERPLLVRVFLQDGYVVVDNNLQRKPQPAASTGNGLDNLIKRYALLSGDGVVIRENNEQFAVWLKILKA